MKPKKYMKKPVVIDAIQYSASRVGDLLDFVPNDILYYCPHENKYYIRTLEGNHMIIEGDYVICGVAGEFYSCKPYIFEQTYEEVDEV